MNCGQCGEELDPKEECKCPGSSYCTCEFNHHHRGCCESYEDLVTAYIEAHPGINSWDAVGAIPQPILDAHDEYLMRG